MNVNSVKFRSVENIYRNCKVQKAPQITQRMDTVEISELGKYLNQVNTNKDEINIDKINEIKQRIENGTYKVDSKDLAKKIIEHMKGEK